jgi:hypothetical protein
VKQIGWNSFLCCKTKPISVSGSTTLAELGRFFSSLILYTVSMTPWTSDQPVTKPLPTHRTTQTQNKRTDIHASSEIRTHDPSVRSGEDGSCLRPRGHCDRPEPNYFHNNWGVCRNLYQKYIGEAYMSHALILRIQIGLFKVTDHAIIGLRFWLRRIFI